MNKYLLAILKEINTIIIPGLGALTITNTDTGEIMFMPYLKHDDGKLAAHIAEKEGWEENDAINVISKYVREILSDLDQGKSYDMFQFGTFFKNDDGDIDFKTWDNSNTKVEKEPAKKITKKTEVQEEKVVAPKVEKKKEAVKKVKAKVYKAETKKEKVVTPKLEKKKETVKKEKITTPKVEKPEKKTEVKKESPKMEKKVKIASTAKVEEENQIKKAPEKKLDIAAKEEIARGSAKLEKLRKEQEEKPSKKKRGAGFWVLTSILIIIIAGSVAIMFNFNNIQQHIPFLASEKTEKHTVDHLEEMKKMMNGEDDSEIVEEEIIEEEINDEENSSEETNIEPVEEKIIETEPEVEPNTNSSLPYHIIVGAFGSESNANRLADKLRSEGNTVRVGPGRGLTLVSVNSFASKEEANASLSNYKGAWVYYWE